MNNHQLKSVDYLDKMILKTEKNQKEWQSWKKNKLVIF